MSTRLNDPWGDRRVLFASAVLISILAAVLLYLLLLRPLAAASAAQRLQDLVQLGQKTLLPLSSEQQAAVTEEGTSPGTFHLVDDAATPRFDRPNTGWLRLVADELSAHSRGGLVLRTTHDDAAIWVNVDTVQRRYWLAVPVDRLNTVVPIVISMFAGFALMGGFALAILLSTRYRTRLTCFSEALRRIGTGDVVVLLPEAGGGSERDFSEAFNTMSRSLQRLDAESRLLLGGISHDLRTPLTSMRLGLELAKDDMEPGLAASLYQDANDLESILNQFLDYARDDTLESVEGGDINELILDIAKRVTDRGHDIDLDLSPLPMFRFRKLAMRRLITNLVNNAVNYGGRGMGVLTRATSDRGIVISVVDRGPGVEESQLRQMMRPFVRGALQDNRHPGSGLGLTIASRIARIHGGTLSLQNRPEGGLEARIELPTRYDQG